MDELERCVRDHTRLRIRNSRERLNDLTARLRRMDLRLRFAEAHRRLDSLHMAAVRLLTLRMTQLRAQLDPLQAQLRQLSPLAILDRGYALVHTTDGVLVKRASQAPPGTGIQVKLAEGRLKATVEGE